MTTKTPESLFLELGQEFTDLAMDTNAKLIVAVDEEKYEDAAKHRDFIKTIIENTVQMSLILLTLDENTIRESFTRQNEIVYNALLEEYNALLEEYNNPTPVVEFKVGDVVTFNYGPVSDIRGTIGSIDGDLAEVYFDPRLQLNGSNCIIILTDALTKPSVYDEDDDL